MSRQLALALLAASAFEGVAARNTFSQPIARKSGKEIGGALFAGHQRVSSQALVTTVDDQVCIWLRRQVAG